MKSFFEKLTGAVDIEDGIDESIDEEKENRHLNVNRNGKPNEINHESNWMEEEAEEGELTIDMFQDPEKIVVKTMVAGVKPEDLDISITRDMVTIKGKREESHIISEDDYFAKELYWGSFSRTITLPSEIDIEEAKATEKHGLLILELPKIDKGRQTKLKVKAN
ncbi:Hsp20/alpha crystallin family protein [Patescibacteria group bacterium]|nr:Hsp20/alpha crystallin family protein [Patescibacteria group bacterium]MCG2694736.1 Hsp20/alpha crystallin family protein [Candidatus Parcubacteria bacterium]